LGCSHGLKERSEDAPRAPVPEYDGWDENEELEVAQDSGLVARN